MINYAFYELWSISTVGRPRHTFRTIRKLGSLHKEMVQKLGALAQLVARDIRIVEARSSNLLCSTTNLALESAYFQGFFTLKTDGVLAHNN